MIKDVITHKFDHNSIEDLESKLLAHRKQELDALICVVIEGLYRYFPAFNHEHSTSVLIRHYSMEGSFAPIPYILALKRIYKFTLLVDEAHSFMSTGSAGRGSFNHWQDLGFECPFGEVDVMTCMFSKSVGCTGGMVVANNEFAEELHRQDDTIQQSGVETLPTIVLIRIISLLRKPLLIKHRMRLIYTKAVYVAQELSRMGCAVLSSPGSAIVCFFVGKCNAV